MPEHLFVYFKTPAAMREQTGLLINTLAAQLGGGLTSNIQCSRRADLKPASDTDTWLEHYQCENAADTAHLLQRLARIDPRHPLVALTIDGLAGRHIEHFVCV